MRLQTHKHSSFYIYGINAYFTDANPTRDSISGRLRAGRKSWHLSSLRCSVGLRAHWKSKTSRLLCCCITNISWLRGVLIKNYTLGLWADPPMIYTSSDWLVLWALQRRGLRCQLFRPASRRPEIESRVRICKVSIYSIFKPKPFPAFDMWWMT